MRNLITAATALFLAMMLFVSCQKDVDDDRDPNHPYNTLIVGNWKFESDSIIEDNTGRVDKVYTLAEEFERILSLRSDGSAEFSDSFGDSYKFSYYITREGKFASKREDEKSFSPGSDILLLNSTTLRMRGQEYYTTSSGGRGHMTSTYKRK